MLMQAECEKTGMMFVGRGRIISFNEDKFAPGKPHVVDVACDLWPTITYTGKGYKGLAVTVSTGPVDSVKIDAVKKSITERYKVLASTPLGYSAAMGDVVVADMKGFEKGPDGSKGNPLPAIASGDQVEVHPSPSQGHLVMICRSDPSGEGQVHGQPDRGLGGQPRGRPAQHPHHLPHQAQRPRSRHVGQRSNL